MKETIIKYLKQFPEDKDNLAFLQEQLISDGVVFNRKNFKGHIVANALVLNKDKTKVLAVFHNILKLYLQPGGHVDETDQSVLSACFRELEEETGITEYSLHPWHELNDNIPILIETHEIPENIKKQEEKHLHHDFLYAIIVKNENVVLQTEEVSDFKWLDINEVLSSKESYISKGLKRLLDQENNKYI